MGLKGWGSPNSNEGTYTVVLYIYKYFVPAGIGWDSDRAEQRWVKNTRFLSKH